MVERSNVHHSYNNADIDRTLSSEWESLQDKIANIDQLGLAKVRNEERRQEKRKQQTISPHRQTLLASDQPPSSIRTSLYKNSGRSDKKVESKSPSPEVQEMTDLRRMQLQTESIIQDRIKDMKPPKRSVKIKLPQAQARHKSCIVAPDDELDSSSDDSSSDTRFNPNTYIMRHEPNFVQDQFRKEFYDFMKVSRKKISQKLAELVYVQVEDAIENHFQIDVPNIFRDNLTHFSGLLIKSKKLQGIFSDFTDQISKVMEYEISHQKTFIKDYLSVPRIKGEKGVPEIPFIPENTPNTRLALSVFSKAKDHIKEVQRLYIQKERKKKKQIKKAQELEERRKSILASRNEKIFAENKPLFTPIQETLLERINAISNQAQLIEENTLELQEDVMQAEKDLSDTRAAKQGKRPGVAISNLLQRWENEVSWFDHEQMKKYVTELWVTKEKFEEELKEQQTAIKLELTQKTAAFVARVDSIRSNASFQIQALESALIEIKLKAARDVERAEMRLAEMESAALRKQKTESFITNALKQAQDLMDPYYSKKTKLTDEEMIEMMRQSIGKLLETVESLNSEKSEQIQRNQVLEGTIARDQAFNKTVQDDFRNSKEMLIYYQMLVHDLLARTKVFETDGVSKEDKLLFSEIYHLNAERLRLDAEDLQKFEPDPRRPLQRLATYCDDLHKVFVQLDIKTLFDYYTKTQDDKTKLIQALVLELSDLGLIIQNSVNVKSSPMKLDDLVLESDLKILDKKNVDPSFQRFVPRRKQELLIYEDLKNYTPIGIVRPERKMTIHTFLEQLLVPNQDRLQLVIEREKELAQQRIKATVEAERKKKEAEEEKKRQSQLRQYEMMEAQHFDIVNKLNKKPTEKEKKKLIETAQKSQRTREKALQNAQKKEQVKQNKQNDSKTKANEPRNSPSPAKKHDSSLQISPKANEKVSLQPEVEAVMIPIKEIVSPTASNLSKPSKAKQSPKYTQPPVSKRSNRNQPFIKSETNTKSKTIDIKIIDEKDQVFDLETETFSQVEQKETAERIEEVLNIMDHKVEQKYSTLIDQYQDTPKESLVLKNKDFDLLYQTFQQSLGQDINSKDYISMYTATNIETFIDNANKMQEKYVRKKSEVSEVESFQTGQQGVKGPQKESIQMSDIIQADIDDQGEFQGFKIRPTLAKVWFLQNNSDVSKLAKVIKTNNHLNRIIHDQEPDFALGNRKVTKDLKSVGTECNLLEVVEKVVIKDVIVRENQRPLQTQSVNITQPENPSSVVNSFFDVIRSHCIDVLMRETPGSTGYYKIVWANQQPEELIKYKMPYVFDQVPEGGINEDERVDLPVMTVMEYFQQLFKLLGNKLLMNVPREEKKDLDLKKWIWAGDHLEKPDVSHVIIQTDIKQNVSVSCQANMLDNNPDKSHDKLDKPTLNSPRFNHLGFSPRNVYQAQAFSRKQSAQQREQNKQFRAVAIQTDVDKFANASLEGQRAAERLKEQIDEVMGEEIAKTIESMQLFVDQVKSLQTSRAQSQLSQVQTDPIRKGSVLKQKLQVLRNNFKENVEQIKAEKEEQIFKKIKRQSQLRASQNELQLAPKSQFSRPKINIGQIELPEVDAPFTYGNKKFVNQHFSQRNTSMKDSNKTITFVNPFKQTMVQDFPISKVPRSINGRSVGNITPRIIHVNMGISPTNAGSQTTYPDNSAQLISQTTQANSSTNFFTGKRKQEPLNSDIMINANFNYYLRPNEGPKRQMKTPILLDNSSRTIEGLTDIPSYLNRTQQNPTITVTQGFLTLDQMHRHQKQSLQVQIAGDRPTPTLPGSTLKNESITSDDSEKQFYMTRFGQRFVPHSERSIKNDSDQE